MICLNCMFRHGKNTTECKFCGNCADICRQKCVGLLRAKAIDNKPIVYSMAKEEPLARKLDRCPISFKL